MAHAPATRDDRTVAGAFFGLLRLIKELADCAALQSALHIDAATAAPMGVGMMQISEYRPDLLATRRHES